MIGEPPRSPYDVNFRVAGIPVRVHWMFWIVAVLLNLNEKDFGQLLIWVAAMFISILIHELGHALAIRYYGWEPWITLYGMGGLASYNPSSNYGRKGNRTVSQIAIALAGPVAGFAFAASLIAGLYASNRSMPFIFPGINFGTGERVPFDSMAFSWLWNLLQINIMWGAINLLPVYPLDGGRISRELFLAFNPGDGVRMSLALSVATAVGLVLLTLFMGGGLYTAFLFGYLGYSSYMMLQGPGGMSGFGGRRW